MAGEYYQLDPATGLFQNLSAPGGAYDLSLADLSGGQWDVQGNQLVNLSNPFERYQLGTQLPTQITFPEGGLMQVVTGVGLPQINVYHADQAGYGKYATLEPGQHVTQTMLYGSTDVRLADGTEVQLDIQGSYVTEVGGRVIAAVAADGSVELQGTNLNFATNEELQAAARTAAVRYATPQEAAQFSLVHELLRRQYDTVERVRDQGGLPGDPMIGTEENPDYEAAQILARAIAGSMIGGVQYLVQL